MRNKPLKYAVILKNLYDGNSLNRFEAERIGDHCLNSTISTIQNKYGIFIHAERETVPCRVGMVSVNRYSLPASERGKAERLLNAKVSVSA